MATRKTTATTTQPAIPEPPGWFVVADRREWIACDDLEMPDHAGFAIYVRTGITNLERRLLLEQHDAIVAYGEAWDAMPAEERDWSDTPHARERRLIAPYVLAWNAIGYDASGERGKLPSPAAAGPEIFEAVDDALVSWIVRVVLVGYLVTGKVRRSPRASAPSGATAAPSPIPDST